MNWVRNLYASYRFKTPIVPQLSAFDCGVAVLGTILKYNAIHANYMDLLDKAGTSRDGTSTSGLIRAARAFALEARIRQCTAAQALAASMPSIVFWGGSHFVVLEGTTKDRVAINDPQSGRRVISKEQFLDRYAGRLIEFDHPKQQRSALRAAKAAQGRLLRLASCFIVVLLTGLALAWIGLRQAEHVSLAPMKNAGLVLFLGVMALIAIGVLFPLDTNLASQTTKYLPWNIRQIWPQPVFLKTKGNLGFNAPIASSLCLFTFPGGLTAIVSGTGFMTLWSIPLLLALFLAFVGLDRRQKWLGQNAIASTGAQRLRAQFAELCLYPDQLKLHLRDSTFASTFLDWQRRRYQETRSLTRCDVLKTGCVGIIGATAILAAVVLMPDVAAWLVLTGILLSIFSVFMFAVRSGQIDPTRQHAISRVIGAYSGTKSVQAKSEVNAPKFSKLQIQDVTFSFDPDAAPVLLNLSLTLKSGDIVAVSGAAACGKTSLGRLAAGHYGPQRGTIQWYLPDADTARICYLTEVPLLTEVIYNLPDDLISELELMKLVGTNRRRKYNKHNPSIRFSQGERQRLSIALGLASKPNLLVLDDALTCVDEDDLSCIIRAVRSRGIICLILSNRWPLLRLCDRIELLDQKQLTCLVSPEGFEAYRELLTRYNGAD